MNINTAFPSTTLKAADLGDTDVTYTIDHVTVEEIGQGKDKETKPFIYFKETEKGLVLNKTNANTITGLYGPETDDWAGKRITLFATEVDFQGSQTLAIRVRMRKPGGAAAAAGAAVSSAPQSKAQKAWALYQEKTPGLAKAEQAAGWKTVLAELCPGKRSEQITDEEWDSVLSQFNTALLDDGTLVPF